MGGSKKSDKQRREDRKKIMRERRQKDDTSREEDNLLKRKKNTEKSAYRENENEYNEKEKVHNKLRMKEVRSTEEYKEKEKANNKLRMKELRSTEEYKVKEKDHMKLYIRELRSTGKYKEKEKDHNKLYMKKIRSKEEYNEKEKDHNKLRMKELRAKEEYNEKEKDHNKLRMKELRAKEEYNEKEKNHNKLRMIELRAKEEYNEKEKNHNKFHMKELRAKEEYNEKEKHHNKLYKTTQRVDEILKFRETIYKNLVRNDSNAAKLMLQFLKARKLTPDYVCCCCEGLYFRNSVVIFKNENILEKYTAEFTEKIINFKSSFICQTCNRYVKKGVVPKPCTNNELKFAKLPECLKSLSALEERMVSPYIPFMQIRALKSFAINPQLGAKGSVVNIPVEVNDMIQVLPRQFSDMSTVQIKLKRHIQHSTNYMFETVRPAVICEALQYLIQTPLYRKHDIQIDSKFFSRYENNINVNFIVEPDDHDSEDINIFHGDNNDNKYGKIEDFDLEIEDEVLLFDRNAETAEHAKIIAPGQGKQPLAWHLIEDMEELCFPKIFAGHPFGSSSVSYSERVKSEARRNDRRSCIPTRLLFMAKKKLEKACIASINVCLRKTRKSENISARNVKNPELLDKLVKFNEGYKFMKQIRSSPPYWENKKKNLMAMLRQLGKPTFFVTLSAAESRWPELIKTLHKLNTGENITIFDAMSMEQFKKTELVRNDPVTCARYFDYKARKMMWLLKQSNSIFGQYIVEDSYERIEFQNRGSPHEHIFLWLKNAPSIDNSQNGSILACVDFIDKFITCHYDENDPYMAVLMHKHSHTCYKGNRNRHKCRFNFPLPVMRQTMILNPLEEHEKDESLSDDFERIKKQMNCLFKNNKKHDFLSFETILDQLNMTEDKYILSIRSSLKRSQVFLKRNSLEVGLNCYNKDILHMFESNMDIQFICEEYGLASYIINYVGKVEAGLSKLLRDAASDIQDGNVNLKEKFRKCANVFINSNLMSAQEAAYHVLSLSLSKCSRRTIYVNTCKIQERVLMLKTNAALRKLSDDSTDIYMPNVIMKYQSRTKNLEDVCLADFVACLTSKNSNDSNTDEEEGNEELTRERQKPAILRYKRYKLDQDPYNYYREQLLLFLPFRNEESEIEIVDTESKYTQNIEIISKNRQKFSIISDEILDCALDSVQNEIHESSIEKNTTHDKENDPDNIDLLEQGGLQIPKDVKSSRITVPQRIPLQDLHLNMQQLNRGQREIVMHVLNRVKIHKEPLRIFLSGSAGVGKSMVIKCIYHLVTHYYDNLPGSNKDGTFVMLCAPSGKAAFLIGGVTLHTAFALPVSQFGGLMPELSADIANTIRDKLCNLKLLVIDEISMVGSTLFSRVDTRLRQIMGVNKSFGDISVLLVGDLNQLPPVMDSLINKVPKSSEMSVLLGDRSPLWDEFEYFELTEIMRQKDNLNFTKALNNLAIGAMTDEDINIINSRSCIESVVPNNAIRLFSENKSVDLYNDIKISKFQGTEFLSEAKDLILGKVSEFTKNSTLNSLKKKKISDVNGLPHLIRLKVGIKYMITTNINVEDGLVNGACGVLKSITLKPNTNEPIKIWLDFESSIVGNQQRLPFLEFMKSENIDIKCTPIEKNAVPLNISNKLQFQILRQQFPVVPAEAITIHKSQGQTYKEICVDFSKSKRITRQMMYVALSRVSSLCGLYVIGSFKNPKSFKKDNPALEEIQFLRSNKQLKLSFINLNAINGIKLVYQNIRSLKQNLKHIQADLWYRGADLLCFAETLTHSNDVVDIQNYQIIFRSNIEDNVRGIICLQKCDLNVYFVKHMTWRNAKYQMELICLKIKNNLIITGYKSPGMNNVAFANAFDSFYKSLDLSNCNFVLMGDFNCDIFGDKTETSFLKRTLSNYNLRTALCCNDSTTNFNTQIDVVFTTSNNLTAGVYESFFSDHKPIYSIINSNDILCESISKQKEISTNEPPPALFTIHSKCSLNEEKKMTCTKVLPSSILGVKKKRSKKNSPKKKINKPYLHMESAEINTTFSCCKEILNIHHYVTGDEMEIYREIVKNCTAFQPQCVYYTQWLVEGNIPGDFASIPAGMKNVQILFRRITASFLEVGHWLTSYYDGNCVHIYDSIDTGNVLHEDVQIYLKHLYPYIPVASYQIHQVQRQSNSYDCGLFAMAFTTTICQGGNPTTKMYNTSYLREHAFKILNTKQLEEFPLS